MGGVKFCKDCKWASSVGMSAGTRMWWCNHVEFGEGVLDLVTGERESPVRQCSDVRADEALCGEHAKWFEPKE